MDPFIIGAIIFTISVAMIEFLRRVFEHLKSSRRTTIRKRLRKYSYPEEHSYDTDILRKEKFSEIPLFNKLLVKMRWGLSINRLILQANAPYTPGFYISLSVLLGASGYLCAIHYKQSQALSLLAGASMLFLPYLHLVQLRQKRLLKFKRQLPEGLDLIARALKAGQGFNSGLKLVSGQFDDPLGPEFAETLDEVNFGVSVPDALKNLAKRIDCPEVRYFVVAVILQRETGGNLADLIESLAHIIRENFKFNDKVQTLAAEGKVSAMVLIALPFAVLGWIYISTPNFLNPLFNERIGRIMLGWAGAMMAVGIVVIRKLIKIDM